MQNLRSYISRVLIAGSSAAALALFISGCSLTPTAGPSDTVVTGFSGVTHGGPNPVIGAKVVIYSTTSTGYGAGNFLQEADQKGTSAHQDTDGGGNFHFSGGFTCPAGQYAYVVVYGGNTGGNTNNPNSVLMAALGPCGSLYSGTAYTGQNLLINEVTTIAAGYALANFTTVTGDASAGYTVGIGASATNNSTSGCVANAYYTGCTTTAAAGLKHAFANALMLANPFTGTANGTSSTGATIPFQLINTLGNVFQACVNSNGGGTNVSGAPSTTTSASGTTHDGTPCGKLFAFTSYTLNGTATGTLVAPGNTLSAVMNLAKRPSGSATLFNSTCDSNSTGTTTATQCIFNLAAASGFYSSAMTAAPPDWMLGISYPKGSFATQSSSVTCGTTTQVTPANNGTLYPYWVATDINDNITILNEDQSSGNCYNLLTIGSDGTSIAGNAFDTSVAFPLNVATDSYGHAIVPAKSGSGQNGIYVYAAGNDSTITLATSISGTSGTTVTGNPQYVAVDGNDDIFVSSRNNVSNSGYLTPATRSHSTPTYNTAVATGGTSSTNQIVLDTNGAAVVLTSSGSGTGRVWGIAPGGTAITQSTANAIGGSTSNAALGLDTAGNGYIVLDDSGATHTYVEKFSYTATGGTFTFSSQPTGISTPTYTFNTVTISPSTGAIDGNNVLWFAERSNPGVSGATATSGHVRAYDTVNNFGTNAYMGCKFLTSTATVCGSTDPTTGSSTPYLAYQTRGMAIDSAGDIWLANASQGQVNEIIGLAAPTWPLFIHNGASNRP